MLMKTANQSLTEQLSGLLAERIRTRLLAPGARLGSVRECARQQGVSPSTVVAAYDHLLAQGLVEARRNRGFLCANGVGVTPSQPAWRRGWPRVRRRCWFGVRRSTRRR
jgi:DNA-binding transcriptional regulator YhcF (GntR family)